MKTLLLPFGVLAMLVLALGTASAANFTDVDSTTPHAKAIEELKEESVINGYADGSFRPNTLVNRAEFLKMIILAMGDSDIVEINPSTCMGDDGPSCPTMNGFRCFSDFTGAEQWYWRYACEGKDRGVVVGNPDGSFKGTKTVNLAEALAMSVRAWRVTEPRFIRQPDHWYDTYMIATQSNTKLFDELPFEPNRALSRAETAAVINAFMALPQPVSMCDGHNVGETYKDDCNTCTCTKNGAACTKMACIHNDTCTFTRECSANEVCTAEESNWTECRDTGCGPNEDCACIGVCKKADALYCLSSDQCGANQICTTEDGDCMRPPCPANEPNCIMPTVCMGLCRAQ